MQSHRHTGGPGMTQNQGNVIGDKPCVRQSALYRKHEGGNAMKELMGHGHLNWDTKNLQGAYAGQTVYDHNTHKHMKSTSGESPAWKQQEQQQYQQPQQQYQQQQYNQPQQQQSAPWENQQASRQPLQPQRQMSTGMQKHMEEQAKPHAQVGRTRGHQQSFNIFTGQ